MCLDEPTNHLDVDGREGLERALKAFPGAVLLITHDRQLIDSIVDRVIYLEGGHVRSFTGGLAECMATVTEERQRKKADASAQKRRERAAAATADPAQTTTAEPSTKIRNPMMFERLESEIMQLETDLESTKAQMTEEPNYRDPAKMRALQTRATEIQAALADAYQRWENWS